MIAARYPKAKWLGNGVSGGSFTGGPAKAVIHTTETVALPGYNSGRSAPHVTYAPLSRRWWQHTEFTGAARALRNESGGVQTNRDTAYQLEVICYSDERTVDRYGRGTKVSQLPDHAYEDIAEWVAWTGVPFVWPGRRALSWTAANSPGFRMTQEEWDNYHGVCGHQHVPENTHWDPGGFDWEKLMAYGELFTTQEDDMAWEKPGDPVNSLEDARAVHAYQGGSVIREADFAYDENDPRYLDERNKVFFARTVDLIMQLDQRLAALKASAPSTDLSGIEARINDLSAALTRHTSSRQSGPHL